LISAPPRVQQLSLMLKSIINKRARRLGAPRPRLGALVALAAMSLAWGAFASHADAKDFFTIRELLAEQFKASQRVTYLNVHASPQQAAHMGQQLGRALPKTDYTVYVALTAGHVDGYALFDDERGQHEPISFGTFFDADGHVTRVEVMAYREPFGDGVRAPRFRQQFVGRDAHSGFTPDKDIDAVSGATISSRSLCVGVKRAALVLDELVVKAQPVLALR